MFKAGVFCPPLIYASYATSIQINFSAYCDLRLTERI